MALRKARKSHLAAAARAREGRAAARRAKHSMISEAPRNAGSRRDLETLAADPVVTVPEDAYLASHVEGLTSGAMSETEHRQEGAEEPNSSGAETVQEMEGAELMTSLKQASESVYCKLMRAKSKETWIQGEKELRGTRIGGAARTERDHRWKAKNDDVEKAVIRDS